MWQWHFTVPVVCLYKLNLVSERNYTTPISSVFVLDHQESGAHISPTPFFSLNHYSAFRQTHQIMVGLARSTSTVTVYTHTFGRSSSFRVKNRNKICFLPTSWKPLCPNWLPSQQPHSQQPPLPVCNILFATHFCKVVWLLSRTCPKTSSATTSRQWPRLGCGTQCSLLYSVIHYQHTQKSHHSPQKKDEAWRGRERQP